jgi:hypothetical protein
MMNFISHHTFSKSFSTCSSTFEHFQTTCFDWKGHKELISCEKFKFQVLSSMSMWIVSKFRHVQAPLSIFKRHVLSEIGAKNWFLVKDLSSKCWILWACELYLSFVKGLWFWVLEFWFWVLFVRLQGRTSLTHNNVVELCLSSFCTMTLKPCLSNSFAMTSKPCLSSFYTMTMFLSWILFDLFGEKFKVRSWVKGSSYKFWVQGFKFYV